MAVSSSTMKCPVCHEQILETLSTSFGTWERCPNCTGVFIRQGLIIAASTDRAPCVEALSETKGLLLPTDRSCPKCLQKLFDGRVQSRGVIFSLCPTCDSVWTTLPTLTQFEEAIAKKLAAETQASGVHEARADAGAKSPSAFLEDTALSRLFRAFARLFDNVADSFRSGPDEEDFLLEEEPVKKPKEPKPAKPAKPAKPGKIIKSVEPTPPPAVLEKPKPAPAPSAPPPVVAVTKPPEPVAEAPKIEVPEFIFPEEPPLPTPAP